MSPSPTVSVVIPLYNREAFIGAAIESVLAQTFTDHELLVLDDGSTDGSGAVIARYRDPRLRVLRHAQNLGIPRTRNDGIDAARGRYLAFLDSDDIAYPQRLAKQLAFLERHPDHVAVGAWVDWMDERGRRLRRVKRRPCAAADVAAMRLFQQGIENTTSLVRTSVIRDYRHDERCEVSEDFDLWARIAARHAIANLPEVLVCRRAHGQQVSRGKEEITRRYRHAIYARQLAELGITFDADDLERHHLLRRMRKVGFRPDRAYVDWAERWLLGLQRANARYARYPEPSFSHQLAMFWVKVCLTAGTAVGWTSVGRRLGGSPLLPWAWQGLRKDAVLNGPRPLVWLLGTA